MRQMHRYARPPPNFDRIPITCQRLAAIVAVMRAVKSLIGSYDLAEFHQFVIAGKHAGCVSQSCRQADCPFAHTLVDDHLHAPHLGGGRLAILHAHDSQAHCTLRGEGRHIDDRATVEEIQVVGQGGPVAVEIRQPIPGGQLFGQDFPRLRCDRRQSQPVMSDHIGGHALIELALVSGIDQRLQIGMRVHVDETRADDTTIGLDGLLRGGAGQMPNRHDLIAIDSDIRPKPGRSRAVNDAAAHY